MTREGEGTLFLLLSDEPAGCVRWSRSPANFHKFHLSTSTYTFLKKLVPKNTYPALAVQLAVSVSAYAWLVHNVYHKLQLRARRDAGQCEDKSRQMKTNEDKLWDRRSCKFKLSKIRKKLGQWAWGKVGQIFDSLKMCFGCISIELVLMLMYKKEMMKDLPLI